MSAYLGLDIGATKTHCLIAADSGEVIGFGKAGTGNYESFGVAPAKREIEKAVSAALSSCGKTLADIVAVGLGVAGADLPEDYIMLEREIFTPLFNELPRVFRNDSMGGLRGGTREPFGIVIACGTGCVCAGINQVGVETRVGGICEEFGDMVSGSSLGLEGLKAVWRYRDGIIGKTLLVEKFLERSGCPDLEAFFLAMYRQEIGFADLQPAAKLVFDAALEGDETACDILEWGGRYLGKMVNAVARKLDMCSTGFDVVMTGSVFKGRSPVLRDALQTVVHRQSPLARPVQACFEPVVGCLLMAMEIDSPVSDAIYQALSASLAEAEVAYGTQFKAV